MAVFTYDESQSDLQSLLNAQGVSGTVVSGGIYNYSDSYTPEGSVTVQNSIIANSSSGGNCAGGITDEGGNISYPDQTCPGLNVDPKLDPQGLRDNGGPTKTIALLPGSPAIDAGVSCPPPATDQRGYLRPAGSACDIGAYEYNAVPTAVTLWKTWIPWAGKRFMARSW